jgi:hypothetical protein
MIPFKELDDDKKYSIVNSSMGEDWHDCLLEDIKEELETLGFTDAEISYSGFWSQGDGASFTCDKIDLEKFFNSVVDIIKFTFTGKISKEASDILDSLNIDLKPFVIRELIERDFYYGRIYRSDNYYYHSNSVSVDLNCEMYVTVKEEFLNFDSFELTEEMIIESDSFLTVFEDFLSNWVRVKCDEIYKRLYDEYTRLQNEILKELEEENDLWAA